MHQKGVSVSPIPLLSGASPFCETIFEDAIVPVNDLIGGLDRGWTVGKRLLQFERSTHAGINISGSQGGRTQESELPMLVKQYVEVEDGRILDIGMRTRLTQHEMNTRSQQITQRRAIAEMQSRAPGFTSSAVKLTNALNIQDGDEILMDAMGTEGYRWDTQSGASDKEIAALKRWLYQKSLTIAGGTKEVQLNIIAKRVLGLPD
ncbi:MAG: alkylation response protein AidB-like acyl-CoA dehydrogenase [Candidatus Azotimanducaceae bacterium]|jgi:alkylation response protein AidB-like acyl-CoA dehydrogenase